MKTNELIRRLQEADPSGEMEVTVGKTDIHFIGRSPAYWDGCYQILKRDPALEGKCYNIIGAEIRSEGSHICINTHSVEDILDENPDAPVTFDSEYAARHYRERVDEWRSEARKIIASVRAQSDVKRGSDE
jgi:hypothetical protein